MRDRYSNLKQGLVGAWIPSLSTGGRTLLDVSGYNNHATIDSRVNWVASGDGVCLDGGTTGGARVTTGNLTGPITKLWTNSFTISFWYRPRNSYSTVAAFSTDSQGYFYIYPNYSGRPSIYWGYVNGNINPTAYPPDPTNKWTHFVYVVDADSPSVFTDKFYHNGIYLGGNDTGAWSSQEANTPIVFFGGQLGQELDCQMDDIRCYNRALKASEIAQLASQRGIGFKPVRPRTYKKPPMPACAPSYTVPRKEVYSNLKQGLIGAWIPSLGSTASTLLDRSGKNNHGTLTNMDPGTDWIASGDGLCLDFDGSDDYVNTTFNESINSRNDYTINMWVKLNATGTNGYLLALGNPGTNGISIGIGTFIDADQLVWYYEPISVYGLSKYFTTDWTCLGFVDTGGGTPRIYWNGVDIGGGGPGSFNSPSGNIRIGNRLTSYFNGKVDDIRLYNRALSPVEMTQLASKRGIGFLPKRIHEPHSIRATATGNRRRRFLMSGSK